MVLKPTPVDVEEYVGKLLLEGVEGEG
jgi:hypothetical protein